MKISVIVPVHNLEGEITNCLYSLYTQNFEKIEYEVILILDSVTDNSENVINEWAEAHRDMNLKLLKTNCHSASGARNVGLNNASGQYIAFVDGDDYLMNNSALSILYNAIQGYNSVRVMTHIVNDPRGNFSERLTLWLHFFSKELIGETRFCEDLIINEDFEFVKRVRSKPEYNETQINVPLYFYNYDFERMTDRIVRALQISRERKEQGLPPVYVSDEFVPDRLKELRKQKIELYGL